MLKLKLNFICLLLALAVRAQFSHPDFDSLPLFRSAEEKNTYSFENTLLKSLSVSQKGAIVTYSRTGSVVGDIADEFMSSLVKNFGSGSTANFSYPAIIRSNPEGFGWNVGLFVSGSGDQNSTNINSSMYWYNGAVGNIIDDKSQIASFGYSINPYSNKMLKEAYDRLKRGRDSLGTGEPEVPQLTRNMHAIFGDFKGANMVLLDDLLTKLTHIYINGKLNAVVMDDRLGFDGPIFLIKKQKHPYILWMRKDLSESQRADMIRMTLFSKFVFSHQ